MRLKLDDEEIEDQFSSKSTPLVPKTSKVKKMRMTMFLCYHIPHCKGTRKSKW